MQGCLVHIIEVSLQVTAWVEVQLCYVTFINNITNIAKRKGLIALICKQFVVFMDPGKYRVFGRRCNPPPVHSFKLPWNNYTLSCHDSSTANEHADLALINQRIRDNLQALSNFNNAREEGR